MHRGVHDPLWSSTLLELDRAVNEPYLGQRLSSRRPRRYTRCPLGACSGAAWLSFKDQRNRRPQVVDDGYCGERGRKRACRITAFAGTYQDRRCTNTGGGLYVSQRVSDHGNVRERDAVAMSQLK